MAPCGIEISSANMITEMDHFSRSFSKKHYMNAMDISKKLGVLPPKVSTWELYDKSFTFPRVR